MVTLASDAFGRVVTDGLGSADTGGTYTLTGTAADFDVNGSVATIVTAAAGTQRVAALNSVSGLDVNALIRFQFSVAPAGASTFLNFAVRAATAVLTESLLAQVEITAAGLLRLQLRQRDGGVQSNIGTDAELSSRETVTANSWYRLRLEAEGSGTTTVRARLWKESNSEPGGWDVEGTTTATNLQNAGYVAIRAITNGSVTNGPIVWSFDDLLVTDEFAVPPTPPAGDILFVVFAPLALETAEQSIVTRLEGQGYTVAVVADTEGDASWANDRALIIISKTITSSNATKYKGATGGLIFWEDNAQMLARLATIDETGVTGTGWHSLETTIAVNGSAPSALRAGLSGVITFYSVEGDITYAPETDVGGQTLAAAAIKIAEVGVGDGRWVLYAYEAGSTLPDATSAAGRRYYFGLSDNTFQNLTVDGLALWDAAVEWSAFVGVIDVILLGGL